VVHPDLAAPATLASAADKDAPLSRIKVALGQRQCLIDPQSGTPKQHDQGRVRNPDNRLPAQRITATISSPVGGSAG